MYSVHPVIPILTVGTILWFYASVIDIPRSPNKNETNKEATQYDTFEHKVDIITFRKNKLEPPAEICKDILSIMLIVPSAVENVALRDAHRKALPQTYLKHYRTRRIFLLGLVPVKRNITQAQIVNETKQYGDILQGSFLDTYKNLTRKVLTGLHWVTTKCKAEFIVKVDDDILFDFFNVYNTLGKSSSSNINREYFLQGSVVNHARVRKSWDPDCHNCVSPLEYAGEQYPSYLLGWLYMTTYETASRIVKIAGLYRYFKVEDVFITGILSKMLDISLGAIEYYFDEACDPETRVSNLVNEKRASPFLVMGEIGDNPQLFVDYYESVWGCFNSTCSFSDIC